MINLNKLRSLIRFILIRLIRCKAKLATERWRLTFDITSSFDILVAAIFQLNAPEANIHFHKYYVPELSEALFGLKLLTRNLKAKDCCKSIEINTFENNFPFCCS